MQLITMAHYGEAQTVIEKFKLKKVSPDTFMNEEMVLALTGEGPFEAATKTALIIPQYKFKEVINLGVAGTLSDSMKIGDVVQIRTIYLAHDGKLLFKTFQGEAGGIDCITSFERIINKKSAENLRGMGQLVDREAWGVAMAAKTAGLPFRSYKVVSDNAGTVEACELVKEKAEDLGQVIANELNKLLNTRVPEEKELNLQGFHFTFSTQHKFKTLLNKLAIKYEVTEEDALKDMDLEGLLALNLLPKEKTKKLLEAMEEKIDPTRKIIDSTISQVVRGFGKEGIRLQFDPQLESPKAIISMEVANDQELAEKVRALQGLSLDAFSKVMNGEFNVE